MLSIQKGLIGLKLVGEEGVGLETVTITLLTSSALLIRRFTYFLTATGIRLAELFFFLADFFPFEYLDLLVVYVRPLKNMTERSTAWCYVYHKQKEEDLDILRKKFLPEKIKYLVANIEICPTTKRQHIQGYVVVKEKQSLKQMKEILNLGDKINIDKRFGTHDEAKNYCLKTESKHADYMPYIYGEYKQGARTDLASVRDRIKNGSNMRETLDDLQNPQQVKMAETYLKYYEKPRDWKPYIKWLWGPTGSGKTKLAFEESNPQDRYIAMSTAKWWDGYDGHSDIIIDDMRSDFCKYHELLTLLDRYELRVEVKGSTRQFKPKRIWITSCYHPKDMFRTIEDKGQLLRRLDEIVYVDYSEECPKVSFAETTVIEDDGKYSDE